MADTFQCDIVTPERGLFSDLVDFIVLPAANGEMGVLAHHAPTVATLKIGIVRIKQGGSSEDARRFLVNGGYVQIDGKRVVVLADFAVDVSEIDLDAAVRRAASLEEELTALEQDDPKRSFTVSQIEWEQAKIKAAQKRNT